MTRVGVKSLFPGSELDLSQLPKRMLLLGQEGVGAPGSPGARGSAAVFGV